MVMQIGNISPKDMFFSNNYLRLMNLKSFVFFSCHFHVFFHGCAMSTDNIGTEFLENSGLLEMAESNNIVMLFPQVLVFPFISWQ